MRFHRLLLLRFASLTALLSPLGMSAQTSTVTETNLITNGGFEQITRRISLANGVDGDGYLAGERKTAQALTESGSIAQLPMPVSVSFVDLNGDGLPDLETATPTGYVLVYFNSGTKTEPKFTTCEMLPVFLARFGRLDRGEGQRDAAPKISFADWNKRGLLDLVAGNYAGQIIFIPNSGTASAPNFRQPVSEETAMLKTSKGGVLWGNLFAPVAYDWDRDGKMDLLIGEGSYSANSVHLLLNQGTGSTPKFSEEARYYLAFGDGREQLVPTVVDINGDGAPDLLVSDRRGSVGIYLNPGGQWKPGVDLPLSSMVKFGGATELGGVITISAADFNGDGLFDLIIGKNSGRVAVAINRGTKTEPKFDPPFELRSANAKGYPIGDPTNWSTEGGLNRANFYSYLSSVSAQDDPNAQPPEGGRVLKMGYFPRPAGIVKEPLPLLPVSGINEGFHYYGTGWSPWDAHALTGVDSNDLVLRQNVKNLKIGATYTLSFKLRGADARNGSWSLFMHAEEDLAPEKITRGERGSVIRRRELAADNIKEGGNLSVSPTWTTVTRTFTVKFPNKDLKDAPMTKGVVLDLRFAPVPFKGVVYLDDFQLVEKSAP